MSSTMLVYTESAYQAVKSLGLLEQLNNLEEPRPGLSAAEVPGFHHLGSSVYCRRAGTHRILGLRELTQVEGVEISVLIIIDIVRKDDKVKYTNKTPVLMADKLRAELAKDNNRWSASVKKKFGAKRERYIPPPSPLESLLAWGKKWEFKETDWMVYETEEWADKTAGLNADDSDNLYETVYQIVERTNKQPYDIATSLELEKIACGSGRAWYVRGSALDGHCQRSWAYLIYVERNSKNLITAEEKALSLWVRLEPRLQAIVRETDPAVVRDAIGQLSERAYPSLIVYDRSLWRDTVLPESKDSRKRIALALSNEEMTRLLQLHHTSDLPLFLEGRAGSGKSTILFYYFASALFTADRKRHESIDDNVEPQITGKALFVSQSERLCDVARNQVRKLYSAALKMHTSQTEESDFDGAAFRTFQQVCFDSIAPEYRARFADPNTPNELDTSRYISPAKFRRLVTNTHFEESDSGRAATGSQSQDDRGNRRKSKIKCYQDKPIPGVTAEMVWYAIRSFIKGFSIDLDAGDRTKDDRNSQAGWLTPEDYENEVPEGDANIEPAKYREIYERYWLGWYQSWTANVDTDRRVQYWDDQDLARAALLYPNPNAPRYALIVCDEAQDFTRVEMQALLRRMEYVYLNMHHVQGFAFPLVLAGDPFQTINPSGFRWGGMKTELQGALSVALPHSRSVQVKERQLQYNYRNRPTIARLANVIQLARLVLLGSTPKPQKLWRPDRASAPVDYFVLGQNVTLKDLIASQLVLIVPEEPDQEFWNRLGNTAGLEVSNMIVDTPTTIKGLEHPRIAILGFGELFRREFGHQSHQIWNWRDPDLKDGTFFAFEYFLNRVYVAVTRATERLFIVDTPEGKRDFWDVLTRLIPDWKTEIQTRFPRALEPEEPEVQESLVSGNPPTSILSRPPATWDESRIEAVLGSLEDLRESDPKTLAKQYAEDAQNNRNHELALKAAYRYRQIGEVEEALRQEGWAHYFQENTIPASQKMAETGQPKDIQLACDWLWKVAAWKELIDLKFDEKARDLGEVVLRRQFARGVIALQEKPEESTLLDFINLVETQETRHAFFSLVLPAEYPPKADILTVLLETVIRLRPLPAISARLVDLYRLYSSLTRYKLPEESLGDLAFAADDMRQAYKYWKDTNRRTTANFYIAWANVAPYPESLRYWASASRYEEVTQLMDRRSQRVEELPAEYREPAFRALNEMSRHEEALVGALKVQNVKEAINSWIGWNRKGVVPQGRLADLLAKSRPDTVQKILKTFEDDNRASGSDELFEYFNDWIWPLAIERLQFNEFDAVRDAAAIFLESPINDPFRIRLGALQREQALPNSLYWKVLPVVPAMMEQAAAATEEAAQAAVQSRNWSKVALWAERTITSFGGFFRVEGQPRDTFTKHTFMRDLSGNDFARCRSALTRAVVFPHIRDATGWVEPQSRIERVFVQPVAEYFVASFKRARDRRPVGPEEYQQREREFLFTMESSFRRHALDYALEWFDLVTQDRRWASHRDQVQKYLNTAKQRHEAFQQIRTSTVILKEAGDSWRDPTSGATVERARTNVIVEHPKGIWQASYRFANDKLTFDDDEKVRVQREMYGNKIRYNISSTDFSFALEWDITSRTASVFIGSVLCSIPT